MTKYAKPGIDDLLTMNPLVASEWHPTKNILTPSQVTCGSHQRVWWLCGKNHDWQAPIGKRASGKRTSGCPYCANKKVWVGYNDLASQRPDLADMLHPDNKLDAENIIVSSKKRIKWLCGKGHTTETRVVDKLSSLGCTLCNTNGVSKREIILLEILKETFPSLNIYSGKYANRQIDIIIKNAQDKVIYVEYDGAKWHQDLSHDSKKDAKLLGNPDLLKLIRIREDGCPVYKQYLSSKMEIIQRLTRSDDDFVQVIKVLRGIISDEFLIDSDNTILDSLGDSPSQQYNMLYGKLITTHQSNNSLSARYPDIAEQWHSSKNGTLSPEQVQPFGKVIAWWQCDKDHEWEAAVSDRCKGNNCPYCGGRYAIRGVNDLATTHPHLVNEWDWDKNTKTPYELKKASNYRAHWVCGNGHKWDTMLRHRTRSIRPCRKCKIK